MMFNLFSSEQFEASRPEKALEPVSRLEIWRWISVPPILSPSIYTLPFLRRHPTCFVPFDLNNFLSGKRLLVISSSDSLWVLRRLIIPQLFNWSRADRLGKWMLNFFSARSIFGLAKLWLTRRRLSLLWKKCKQVLNRAQCTRCFGSPSVRISQDNESSTDR